MKSKKKNSVKKFWWSDLTTEYMKNISKKKSKKKISKLWSDVYADVDRSKNKPKKLRSYHMI